MELKELGGERQKDRGTNILLKTVALIVTLGLTIPQSVLIRAEKVIE